MVAPLTVTHDHIKTRITIAGIDTLKDRREVPTERLFKRLKTKFLNDTDFIIRLLYKHSY